jgi:acyl-coenzyme A thioesterase PaaI-like protein
MAVLPNSTEMTEAHLEIIARGEHLFQQLGTRDVPAPEGHLAIEMDIRPEFSNVRGALQGGLISVLIDVCAGRLAYLSCDHESGYSTATSDLTFISGSCDAFVGA